MKHYKLCCMFAKFGEAREVAFHCSVRYILIYSYGCKRKAKQKTNLNFNVHTSCITNSQHELMS